MYRLGQQKFGVATIIPPQAAGAKVKMMSYLSNEDKSLKLPFTFRARYEAKPSENGSVSEVNFNSIFRLNK